MEIEEKTREGKRKTEREREREIAETWSKPSTKVSNDIVSHKVANTVKEIKGYSTNKLSYDLAKHCKKQRTAL